MQRAKEPGGAGAVGRTWRRLFRDACRRLGPGRDHEARRLVERAAGWDGAGWHTGLDEVAPDRAVPFLDAMVERRVAGEPLQYVLGQWGFRDLDLLVDRRVLI